MSQQRTDQPDSTALDAVARAVALRHLPPHGSDEYVAVVVDREHPEQAPTVVRIPAADVLERVARTGFHKIPPATIKVHPVWCDQEKCDNGDGSVCHFGSVGTVPASDGDDQEIKVELSVYEHAGPDADSPRQAPQMPEIHVHGVDGDEVLTLEARARLPSCCGTPWMRAIGTCGSTRRAAGGHRRGLVS